MNLASHFNLANRTYSEQKELGRMNYYSVKKYIFYYIMPLLFVLLLIQPTYSDNEMELSTLKPGTLVVATYFTNPPFEFVKNGQQTGFEVDLITEISKRLNLHLEFKQTRWESIIHELRENHYDLIMGAITITPARERIISFSQPYMTTTLSIVINAAKTPQVHLLADLHEQTMGIQAATTDLDIAKQMKSQGQLHGIKIYPFKYFDVAIDDLVAGKIGAVMKIFPVAYYYVQQHPELKILAAVPNDPQPLGFGMNKNNRGLMNAVNKAQVEMQADGTYAKIHQKWFHN
jgi:ABC-type amino acid transport substrate-binding protein